MRFTQVEFRPELSGRSILRNGARRALRLQMILLEINVATQAR
jgi:hypothetical protein